MNAKLTWKFLERGSAVKAEIFLRTHQGDSGDVQGGSRVNLQKIYPPRPNTGYANSIGNSWEFFLALLENSVLENLSLVSDKFHRSEPGCGSENSETEHKIHKKHAYGGPKNQR